MPREGRGVQKTQTSHPSPHFGEREKRIVNVLEPLQVEEDVLRMSRHDFACSLATIERAQHFIKQAQETLIRRICVWSSVWRNDT